MRCVPACLRVLEMLAVLLVIGLGSPDRVCLAAPRVAILSDTLPGMDATVTTAVADALRRGGLEVVPLSAQQASDPATLSAEKFFLYVIPPVSGYPASGAAALTRFLQSPAHLLVLGGSPFGQPLWRHRDQWIDQAYIQRAVAQVKPPAVAFDFETPKAAAAWTRSGRNDQPTSAEVVAGGVGGSAHCLKLWLNYRSGVPDGFGAALPKDAVPGRGLLCFWAKGDGQTAQLAVRIIEVSEPLKRGMAVIPLTKNWAYYVLRPEDFRQIGAADPARATRVCFELIDRKYHPSVAEGRHTVYVDQIGVAPDPFGDLVGAENTMFPLIETISPGYKVFPLQDIAALKPRSDQALLDADFSLPVPSSAFSCYRRPEGKGGQRGYQWRWIPLVQALDSAGQERGTAAWMLVHQASLNEGPDFEDAARRCGFNDLPRHLSQPAPREGSICAVCGVADAATLKKIAETDLLGTLARRIRDGVFLAHAGSQEFSYWPGETMRGAATVANYGHATATLNVRMRVQPIGGGPAVLDRTTPVTVAPGQKTTLRFDGPAVPDTGDRYTVTTELLRDGRPIDRIAHEMGVLSTRKPARDEFITTANGEFWLRGKKWHPLGVNYWPRSAIALEPRDYTYHWLTPGYYDPEQIEQELTQLEALGMNLVAIRAHHRNDRRTLLDFLRRCGRHGIAAFLFVQSHQITDDPHYFQGLMMPFHFQEAEVVDFVRETRLADNPALLGYDLIWEPAGWVFGGPQRSFGWPETTPYRQRWDAAWARWIDERYGSLAAAERDWGVPAPRRDGQVTAPSDTQFSKDGPWRVMVCAYRRFMDNLMSRSWNDVSRKLRQLDPQHLLSFRQGNLPAFDFTLTATPKHVDFFAMEGYGFAPGDTGPNAAGFINRYIHFATRGKPFLWVEFGANAWDLAAMQPTPSKLEGQRASSEVIYRAALENGANGAAPWWWAGGYRVGERSDFGILSADGTLRPSGELLRDYAPQFRARAGYPPADTWFTLDRDAHAGGHWWLAFHDGAQAFRAAAADGKKLGIRTPGTGSTSVDTPLLAVGNTPYNGQNPPKYLDAEFNWLKIRVGQGPWIEVAPGATVRVAKGAPIVAAASVGNMQEATWLTPQSAAGKPGGVYLASTAASGLTVKRPLAQDTPWQADAQFGPEFALSAGIAAPTVVELQLTAQGRAWFGEKLRFTLDVAP